MRLTVLLMLFALAACGRPGGPAPLVIGGAGTNGPNRGVGASAPPGSVVVARGDSLYLIARRNGVGLRGLIETNRVAAPYVIHPGQVLRLPTARVHVVERGDTVYDVARARGVDAKALVAVNDIPPPYRIYPGQTLVLPARSARAIARAGPDKLADRPVPSAARTVRAAEPPARSGRGFDWPLAGRIILGFGPRAGGLHNDGINISARKGATVRAADSGVVAYLGNELRGFGNLLLLKHADGWMTAYAHNDAFLVGVGDRVRRGQPIARAGASGGVTVPQLHFEIRKGARPVDPSEHLPPPTV